MARHRARWQGREGEQDSGPAFAALPAGGGSSARGAQGRAGGAGGGTS